MRYYFAGAYARRLKLAEYAEDLTGAGIGAVVTSRWLTDPQEAADAGFSADYLTDTDRVQRAWKYGERDLIDLTGSEAIVSFTGEGTRGGRHVEHGLAIDMRIGTHPQMRLIVVGPLEHVFHCHPKTEVFADFEAFLAYEIDRYLHTNREGTK